ncbi:MAG: hypothetical protein U0228_27465 [Myxococcaceae bacterium]
MAAVLVVLSACGELPARAIDSQLEEVVADCLRAPEGSSLWFDPLPIDCGPRVRTITLTNICDRELTVRSARVSTPEFSITQLPTAPIPPGASAQLAIQLENPPRAEGGYEVVTSVLTVEARESLLVQIGLSAQREPATFQQAVFVQEAPLRSIFYLDHPVRQIAWVKVDDRATDAGWRWDPTQNAITFDRAHVPPLSSLIEIAWWDTRCVP